jgi:cytochrome c oxidase assembly protein subunit 11
MPTVIALCTILGVMLVLVSYSPTLYRLFCAATGYAGTVRQASISDVHAAKTDKTVKVNFDANVGQGLDWEFRPEQRSVTVHYGEPTKIYYYAKNLSKETVVARAVFNVTPFQAAPYFFKIECFCFTQERLGPGESARMPLVFYLDEQMLQDESSKDFKSLTLSYTFYEQNGLTPEEVAAARDLSAGSKAEDQSLQQSKTASFDNDARRR